MNQCLEWEIVAYLIHDLLILRKRIAPRFQIVKLCPQRACYVQRGKD